MLQMAGLSHVKTIAPDSWGHMWAIIDDMKKDAELAAAIDVVGTHQECYGAAAQTPPPVRVLPDFAKLSGDDKLAFVCCVVPIRARWRLASLYGRQSYILVKLDRTVGVTREAHRIASTYLCGIFVRVYIWHVR